MKEQRQQFSPGSEPFATFQNMETQVDYLHNMPAFDTELASLWQITPNYDLSGFNFSFNK